MTGLQPPAVPVFYPNAAGNGGGNGVTQQLNAGIHDPFAFLLAKPVFRAHRAAAQTIAAGHQWVVWDTIDEDEYSGGSAGSSVYTVQAPGKYLVVALVSIFGTGAAGQCVVPACAVNGASPTGTGSNGWEGAEVAVPTGASSQPKASNGMWIVHANANDAIQIDLYFTGEATQTATDTTAGWQPSVGLMWVSV